MLQKLYHYHLAVSVLLPASSALWGLLREHCDAALAAAFKQAHVETVVIMDKRGDFSSRAVYERAQQILSIGKTQGWEKLEMLSAVGKLAASIFASMENPRAALIAWEECVEQETANVLRVEENG
jgi:hypothetical protein